MNTLNPGRLSRSAWLVALLAVVSVTPTGPGSAQPVPPPPVPVAVDDIVPWRPQFGRGAWHVPGGVAQVASYTLPATAPLTIEAERASSVLYADGGGERELGGASGGRGTAGAKCVELFVQTDAALVLFCWLRLRLPVGAAALRYLQGIDASLGAPIGWVDLPAGTGAWAWFKVPRVDKMAAGLHELQLEALPAVLELDQVVLVRDPAWTPPADGGPATPVAAGTFAKSAVVETEDAVFPEVQGWLRAVPVTLDLCGSRFALEASCDQGKNWRPVPDDGSLAGFVSRGSGTDAIRFRATLTRGDGSGPVLGELRVRYQTPPDATFAVEDDTVRWLFARKTGALCGVFHKSTGINLTPPNRPVPLFLLRAKKPGFCPEKEWTTVDSLGAVCVESAVTEKPPRGAYRQLRFRYRVEVAGGTADVTVRGVFRAPGESEWTASVSNALNGLDIVELACPILSGVKTGLEPEKDTVLLNGCYLFAAPCRVGRFLYWWPGGGVTVPMHDLSGERAGVTIVSHDPSLRTTGLACEGQGPRGVRLSLHKVFLCAPGQSFAAAPTVVRVHAGDWRQACLLERPTLQKLFPQMTAPPSVRDMDGWEMAGWPVPRWDTFGEYGRKVHERNGYDLLGMWNFQVPGTCWTAPHPNPIMGNAEDFAAAIREFRKSGMRIVFYIQSLLCSKLDEGTDPDGTVGFLRHRDLWPGWELPERGFADRWRQLDAAGVPVPYSTTSRDNEISMCHAGTGFREYKRHWAVEQFGKGLGLDGIYWDSQVHAGPCWNGCDLFHGDPGLNGRGAIETHALINAEFAKLRPDVIMAGEGTPCAATGSVRQIHLANAASLAPIRMLFPQMILVPGGANGQDKDMRLSYLTGSRLSNPGDDRQHQYLAMRRKVKQYLYPADYRDTVGVTVDKPGVDARLLVCDPARTRGALVILLNEKQVLDATLTVDTRTFGPVRAAWLVDSEGHDQPLQLPPQKGSGVCTLPVPPTVASHILLFAKAEPRVTATLTGELVAGGATGVRVRLESLDGRKVSGNVGLRTPQGLTGDDARFTTAGAGEGGAEVTLPLTADLTVAADIVEVPVTVKVRGGPEFDVALQLCVQEPVSAEFAWVGPESVRLRLRTRTTAAAEIRVVVEPGLGSVRLAQGASIEQKRALAAGAQADIQLATTGAADALEPWRLRGELMCRFGMYERRIPLYRQFWPLIPNGSLELCRFRADAPEKEYYEYAKAPDKMTTFMRNIPDYWWGTYGDRSPQVSHSPGLDLDETIPAADGKRSFRLAPGTICRINRNCELYAGTRYRFSAQIRATKPGPQCRALVHWEGGTPPDSGLALRADQAPDTWHNVTTEFTATQDGGTLYLYSPKDATVWLDDFRLLPLSAPGEATK